MYYFKDFNDNEVNIYLLTPEQGAEVVATSSGDAFVHKLQGCIKSGCIYGRDFRKGGI